MIQNFKGHLLLAALSVFVLTPLSYAADSAQDLLQQGILAQTGERDFNKAVDLYRKAIGMAASTPDIAARAELQLGLCYEAMNQTTDAIPAFHAVINLSGEKSPEVVESARTHLQRLESQLTSASSSQAEMLISKASEARSFPWEFSIQLGRLSSTIDLPYNTPFPPQSDFTHAVIWGDVSHSFGSYARVGLEGGNFFTSNNSSDIGGYVYDGYNNASYLLGNESMSQTGFYAGTFAQAEKTFFKHVRPYFRMGVGLIYLTTSMKEVGTAYTNYGNYGFESNSFVQTDLQPAIVPALGVEYDLSSHFSVGVGARDIIAMYREETVVQNEIVTTFRTHHYPIPYGQVAFHW